VIHHLSSEERRILGIHAILSTLHPQGTALIYVWALEQKGSRRGWDESSEQDVMVPWVSRVQGEEVTYQRYYHLFRKGELERCVELAGGEVLEGGWEKVRYKWGGLISRIIGGLL
jgi:tRNA (uracil-5-)-methyltransferase TRM9